MRKVKETIKEIPLFCLAILKGLVENGDYSLHFGSLDAITYHLEATKNLGWIEKYPSETTLRVHEEASLAGWQVTSNGQLAYASWNLGQLPSKKNGIGFRAVFWDKDFLEAKAQRLHWGGR